VSDPVGLWALVEERAAATPDLLMAEDEAGRRVTFGEYREWALRVAAGLSASGVTQDSVVTWILPTWHESLVLAAALARIGATQNPIIPIYRHREVSFVVSQIGSTHLVVPSVWRGFDYAAMAAEIAEGQPGLQVLVADHDLPTADPAAIDSLPSRTSPTDDTWRFFTSGTTASPKGARHSDATVIAAAHGLAERLEVTAADRNSLVFPVTHIAGPIWLAVSLLTGCANLLVETFEPLASSDFLASRGLTFAGPGAAFQMGYLQAQRRQADVPLFADIRCCPCGGSPRSPELHGLVKSELGGAGILSAWGLTEAPILTVASYTDSDEQKAWTEGTAAPGAVVVAVDDAGEDLPAGAEGQLVVTAEQLMYGYVDEALNAEAFDARGRFRTGDLGVVDADGYVRITGRLKEVIIRNGENISAKEVEDLLHQHPRVADVAVIGLPSETTGELACAIVQPADPDQPLDFADMQDFLRAAGLRNQALPERLVHRPVLPRGPEGKVQKRALRAELLAEAENGATVGASS
jgi:acyl-CoA synthetase (AMP-forming)/AMP-acid ligase II